MRLPQHNPRVIEELCDCDSSLGIHLEHGAQEVTTACTQPLWFLVHTSLRDERAEGDNKLVIEWFLWDNFNTPIRSLIKTICY